MDNNSWHLKDAASAGNLKMVKYLIENGADIHFHNDEAFRMACYDGHLEVVKYLVNKGGADVNVKDGYALRWAACKGHFEIVKFLIAHGASLQSSGAQEGYHLAIKYKHSDIVQLINKQFGKLIPIDTLSNDEKYKYLECSICLMHVKNVFFECGHGLCPQCSMYVNKCPFCQRDIKNKLNVIY